MAGTDCCRVPMEKRQWELSLAAPIASNRSRAISDMIILCNPHYCCNINNNTYHGMCRCTVSSVKYWSTCGGKYVLAEEGFNVCDFFYCCCSVRICIA